MKDCRKLSRGSKQLAACCPGVAFVATCNPIAMGLNPIEYCEKSFYEIENRY